MKISKVIVIFLLMSACSCLFTVLGNEIPLNGQIIINGKVIDAPAPFYHDWGVVMIPIAEVAEALGYVALTDENGVSIGPMYRVVIDKNYFLWGGSIQVDFEPSSELRDGCVFTALTFVKHGLKGFETSVSSDGSVVIDRKPNTVVWYKPNNVHAALYADDTPEDVNGLYIDSHTIQTGKTYMGGEIFSLIRMPFGGELLPDEIETAKLFLRVKEGLQQPEMRVCPVIGPWTAASLTRSQAMGLIGEECLVPVTDEGDGWVSVPITDIVKKWISGGLENNGLALLGIDEGETSVFFSGNAPDYANAPYIEVTGIAGERGYGKFGYSERVLANLEWENNLAHAVRDNDLIDLTDLTQDAEELEGIFGDALTEYLGALIERYIELHSVDLCISSFRRLEDYDSEIDPAIEYRIALKVDRSADGVFFDSRVQLDDGRWAEAFDHPETALFAVPPDKIWGDAGDSGKVIYYAVTKDTEEFTSHKPVRNRRADRDERDGIPVGVTIIGDSVSLGAHAALTSAIADCYIDSVVSRQLSGALELIETYQDKGELREYVVIALGTNGSHSYVKFFTSMIDALNAGHRLILVTPFDGRANDNNKSLNEVSEWMRDLPNKYDFITIADWNAAIKSQVNILASDKVHMGSGSASRELYTKCITDAIQIASLKSAKR